MIHLLNCKSKRIPDPYASGLQEPSKQFEMHATKKLARTHSRNGTIVAILKFHQSLGDILIHHDGILAFRIKILLYIQGDKSIFLEKLVAWQILIGGITED